MAINETTNVLSKHEVGHAMANMIIKKTFI